MDYGYKRSSVGAMNYIALIVDNLSDARVFEMVRGLSSSTAKMVDMLAEGARDLAAGWFLKYKQSVRATATPGHGNSRIIRGRGRARRGAT